jgi:type II restriction enzyme
MSGWLQVSNAVDAENGGITPELSHSEVQTMIFAIGIAKGFDIWVPQNDRRKLDGTIIDVSSCREELPSSVAPIFDVVSEIDVLWLEKGANRIHSAFEVEHSTPIYTALLRFNDLHLTVEKDNPRYRVVAEDSRRSLFVKQLNRPTFRASGLNESCSFLEYRNIYGWHQRLNLELAPDLVLQHSGR